MARKPMIVQEEVNISDWKKWVTWKSGNEAMRCQLPVSLGIIHPGLVVLLPSLVAKRYVVGHVESWQPPPMDEPPESKAVTTMELFVEGKSQGKFKVPNASVLCYVDFRIMQPPYVDAPVHPALLGVKKHDFSAYSQIIPTKAPSDLLGKIIIAQQNQINALRQENAVLKTSFQIVPKREKK